MSKLIFFDYKQKYRKEILNNALKAYSKIIEDDKNDRKKVYRNKIGIKKKEQNQNQLV